MMSDIRNNWEKLAPVAHKLYADLEVENSVDKHIAYLKEAYFEIEELWAKELECIDQVKCIVFGEAPLYGLDKSYFYNPDTSATSFFNYCDAEVIVGKLFASNIDKKRAMLKKLSNAGFLIVDLFPFALNNATEISYKKTGNARGLLPKIYKNLFADTIKYHFEYKLLSIAPKTTQTTQFAFRYKKLKDNLESEVLSVLNQRMGKSLDSINSIGSDNIPVDKTKLEDLYHSTD